MSRPQASLVRTSALIALVLGVLTLDRSFVNWRNNTQNFPNVNGIYLPPLPDAPPVTYFQKHGPMITMRYAGLILVVISVALFAKAPIETASGQKLGADR